MEVFTGLSDLMTNGHIKGHLVLIMETQKINKYKLLLLASTYFSRIICWMVPLRFNIHPLIGTQPILICKGRILPIGYRLEEMRLIWCALLMTTNRALKKRNKKKSSSNLVYLSVANAMLYIGWNLPPHMKKGCISGITTQTILGYG